MVACAVRDCSNRSTKKLAHEKKTRISFHRFPHDPQIYAAWVNALRAKRENWNPTKSSVVCSDHFTYDCFDSSDFQRRLVRHAVPTIFSDAEFEPIPVRRKKNLQDPLHIDEPRRKAKKKISLGTFVILDTSKFFLNKPASSSNNVSLVHNEKPVTHLISRGTSISPAHKPNSLSKQELINMETFKNTEIKYIKKIRLLQAQFRNQVKRIAALKIILKDLRKNNQYVEGTEEMS